MEYIWKLTLYKKRLPFLNKDFEIREENNRTNSNYFLRLASPLTDLLGVRGFITKFNFSGLPKISLELWLVRVFITSFNRWRRIYLLAQGSMKLELNDKRYKVSNVRNCGHDVVFRTRIKVLFRSVNRGLDSLVFMSEIKIKHDQLIDYLHSFWHYSCLYSAWKLS